MKKYSFLFLLLVVAVSSVSAQLANWTIGPNPDYSKFPVNISIQIHGACRISQMKFHPTDPNKMYAVTGEGGFFTSVDGGNNWAVKAGTENLAANCASICVDYSNDQVIYLGTGDANYFSNGLGLLKSTNGGTSFSATGLTNCLVTEILQHPTNPAILVAATNKGIYRSINGGTSWTATTSTSIQFCDLKKNEAATSITLYACTRETNARFFRSTDFGSNWTQITSGITTATTFLDAGGRIALTPADTSIVYFEAIGGGGIVHLSSDGGLNFRVKKGNGAPYITFYSDDITSSTQGNYNNCITADRNNPAKIWLQSHSSYVSNDSGVTWTKLTHWSETLHTDMHQVTQSPFDAGKLYSCNDGGIWLSTDGGVNWTPKSDGLYAFEVYANCGRGSNTDRNTITIGTQDNGGLFRTTSGFYCFVGGDDTRQKEYDYLPYGGYCYEKTRSTRRGANSNVSTATGFPTTGNYFEQLAFNRSNPDAGFMWFSDNKLYRSTNLSSIPPTWSVIGTFTQTVMAMHSCVADANRLYFITNDGKFYASSNALGASPTFTSYTLPSASGSLASIAAIANNANTVYISINNLVYVSYDAGSSWSNITYNLPNVNHRRILAEEFGGTQELVFVATNNAVYYKKAGQTTWTNYSTNLPGRKAPTNFGMYDDGTGKALLRYYSYGRGAWETPFTNLRALTAKIEVIAESNPDCQQHVVTFGSQSLGAVTGYSWSFPGGTPATSTSAAPSVSYNSSGNYNITLTITDASGNTSTQTLTKNIQLIPGLQTPVTINPNPANASFCQGGSVSLAAAGGALATSTVELGTGTDVTMGDISVPTLGPNFLQNWFGGSKQMMLFTAAELNGLGLYAGANISGIGINLFNANTAYTLQNLKVKMQTTSLTNLDNFITTGWTTVRNAANYSIAALGWNSVPFNSNFTWDGSSNLLVEVTYSNTNAGSRNNRAYYGPTSFTSTLFYRVDNVNAATVEAYTGLPSNTYAARNNVRFSVAGTAATYTWLPVNGLNSSTGSTVVASPADSTNYFVTATVAGYCPLKDSQLVSLPKHSITPGAGANGSIAPSIATRVNCGASQVFSIVPNAGFAVQDVVVDGVSQGAITSYSFSNVQASHTISASFAAICTPNTWTGAVNRQWSVAANWDCNSVPSSDANITIPATVNQPALDANVTIGNLSLASGATLSLGSNTLTLNGSLAGGGTLSGSASAGVVTNATTNLSFTAAAAMLKTLHIVGGTTTLTNPLEMTAGLSAGNAGTVTVDPGALLATGGNLTFKSNQFGTARLAAGDAAGNFVTGAATVERYIPNNGFRSWRLLSVPVSGSQTIRQAWQEGDANPQPLQNNLPGFGTQITGVGSVPAVRSAGFDNSSPKPALQYYNGSEWLAMPGTNIAIASQHAYFLFVRGERNQGVTGATNTTSATTLRTKGNLYTGDQPATALPANAFSVVGNRYPSAIDFSALPRTGGAANQFYIWDAKKQSGTSLGVYQTFSATNGFACMIDGGSYALGSPNTLIESGQAFFVQTGSLPGSIQLTEQSKVAGTSGNLGFRPAMPLDAIVKIDSRLYMADGTMLDANSVVFDAAYSNAVAVEDAMKIANNGANFAVERTGSTVSVEGRQPPVNGDVIPFRLWNLQQQRYRLTFNPANLQPGNLVAELQDQYLRVSRPVSLQSGTTVEFTVDGNTASADPNRFQLVFREVAPLPVRFTSLKADRTNNSITIAWQVASEGNTRAYQVERSVDGIHFFSTGAEVLQAAVGSYTFADPSALATTLYYRIKAIGTGGEWQYSGIVKVAELSDKPSFSISPNPAKNGTVNVLFKQQTAGNYSIRIFGNSGQRVLIKRVVHAGGSSLQMLQLPAKLAGGIYKVVISRGEEQQAVLEVMID